MDEGEGQVVAVLIAEHLDDLLLVTAAQFREERTMHRELMRRAAITQDQ